MVRDKPQVTAVEIVSAILSLAALVSTAYLWFVQNDKERPRLKTHLVGRHAEHFDGPSKPGHWKLSREIKLAVANYSALPNALMTVRVWVKTRDGAWLEAKASPLSQTELPANISPPTVMTVGLRLTVGVPEGPERATFSQTVAEPAELEVEIADLRGTIFSDVLTANPAP
jgi:hypothetical protein